MSENEEAPPPLGLAGALILVLVHLLVLQLLVGLGGESLLPGAAMVAPLVALYLGLRRYAPHTPTAVALGLGPLTRRQVLATVAGLGLGAVLAPGGIAIAIELVPLMAPKANEPATQAPWIYFVAQFGVILGGEILFRGLVQPRLVATLRPVGGMVAAVTLTALAMARYGTVFVAMMAPLWLVTPILTLRARSTWPAVAAATAYQGVWIAWLIVDV